MNTIFNITCLIWLLSEVLLNRLLHSKGSDRKGFDGHSLWLIWFAIAAAVSVAVIVTTHLPCPIMNDVVIKYTGLGIIWTGIILRFAAVVSLGKFFTVDVTIRKGHRLKTNGLYKLLRHPSYSASLLSFIGFGFALNNLISLLIITIAILAVFIVRIRIEEKVLSQQFGAEYAEYKKHTYALIPFVY